MRIEAHVPGRESEDKGYRFFKIPPTGSGKGTTWQSSTKHTHGDTRHFPTTTMDRKHRSLSMKDTRRHALFSDHKQRAVNIVYCGWNTHEDKNSRFSPRGTDKKKSSSTKSHPATVVPWIQFSSRQSLNPWTAGVGKYLLNQHPFYLKTVVACMIPMDYVRRLIVTAWFSVQSIIWIFEAGGSSRCS